MKIPKFKNDDEAAEFWDTHSTIDYLDDMEDVDPEELAPELAEAIRQRSKTKMVSLRLPEELIVAVKDVALRKDIPYQRLMRSMLSQAVKEETSAGKKKQEKAKTSR